MIGAGIMSRGDAVLALEFVAFGKVNAVAAWLLVINVKEVIETMFISGIKSAGNVGMPFLSIETIGDVFLYSK